jgi:hypothetical protein
MTQALHPLTDSVVARCVNPEYSFSCEIGKFLPVPRKRSDAVFQGLKDYAPTKAALGWTAAGASVLTIVVGFTVGGWVTGGGAERMMQEARVGGQAELAAAVCAANFRDAPTAQAKQAELASMSTTRQRQFVLDQPWGRVPGAEGAVGRNAAEICARMISQMDPAELGEAPST